MRRMDERIRWRATALLAVLVSGLVAARPAEAYRRRGYSYNYAAIRARQQQLVNQAASAQLSAAKQVLAVAESTGTGAQSKLDAALAKLRESAQQFHDAQSTTRHLAKELAEIENEILGEQTDNSPYAKAGKELETARKKLKDVEERILNEQGVQLQLSGLTGSKLSDKKASILELRPDYLEAKGSLDAAGSAVAHMRSELFQKDSHWKEAAEALTKARKEEKEAEEKTHAGTSGRIANTQTVKNAAEAAAVARAAIAQAESVLRANGGAKYLGSSSGGSQNSPNIKRNK
jgi:chromosome segregation ATPase